MSIVSSTYVLDEHSQIDNRVYVRETHTDSEGIEHIVEYLSDPSADHAAIATARGAQIEQQLAEAEAEDLING